MAWLARLFMIVPALVAGWFVSKEDPRYWVIALVVALVLMATSIAAWIYLPGFRWWPGKRK